MTAYPVLILVADEHSARFFVRSSKNEKLVERPNYAETADLLEHGERLADVLVRAQGRTRFKARSLRSQEEMDTYLHRVASFADTAVVAERAVELALVATPSVMNGVRDFIKSHTRQLIAYEICHVPANMTLASVDDAMRRANI